MKSLEPDHFYAKLSIKIDVPKCFEITVDMLLYSISSVTNKNCAPPKLQFVGWKSSPNLTCLKLTAPPPIFWPSYGPETDSFFFFRYGNPYPVSTTQNTGLFGGCYAKLVNYYWGQLQTEQCLSQLNARGRRAPRHCLFPWAGFRQGNVRWRRWGHLPLGRFVIITIYSFSILFVYFCSVYEYFRTRIHELKE